MIVFGTYSCLSSIINEKSYVFNLTSLKEGFRQLNLIPNIDYYNNFINTNLDPNISFDSMFDMYYANEIISNDSMFYEFMTIIYLLYNDNDVIILTSNDINGCDYIAESLQKFIQERYGIISNNVNELDDLNYLVECEFSFNGLYNLDQDKERFVYLSTLNNKVPDSGGIIL